MFSTKKTEVSYLMRHEEVVLGQMTIMDLLD